MRKTWNLMSPMIFVAADELSSLQLSIIVYPIVVTMKLTQMSVRSRSLAERLLKKRSGLSFTTWILPVFRLRVR